MSLVGRLGLQNASRKVLTEVWPQARPLTALGLAGSPVAGQAPLGESQKFPRLVMRRAPLSLSFLLLTALRTSLFFSILSLPE